MKVVYTVLAGILAIALALTVGVGLGIRIQTDYQSGISQTSQLQSNKIALVNQDLGVAYGGEQINFSQSIIETLDNNFVLVSKAAGERGVLDGSYAALVSFPGEFSNQLAQINAVKPEKAMFRYQINPNLSQKDAILTLIRILDLEQEVNETVGFMYASSMLGELHQAQDATRQLLANNESSVEAVRQFSEEELSAMLVISRMERDYPEVEHPDFTDYVKENSDVMSDLQQRYRSLVGRAQDDYEKLVQDATVTIESTDAVGSAIGAMEILPDSEEGEPFFEPAVAAAQEESRLRFEALELKMEEEHGLLLEKLQEFLNQPSDPDSDVGTAPDPDSDAEPGPPPSPAQLTLLSIPTDDALLEKINELIVVYESVIKTQPYPYTGLANAPAPGTAPDPVPDTDSDPAPGTAPDPVPDTDADPAPGTAPDLVPDTDADPAPETAPDPVPDTDPDPAPETDPHPENAAVSDPGPDGKEPASKQTSQTPENQSTVVVKEAPDEGDGRGQSGRTGEYGYALKEATQQVIAELRSFCVGFAEDWVRRQLESDRSAAQSFYTETAAEYIRQMKLHVTTEQEAELALLQSLSGSMQALLGQQQETVRESLLAQFAETKRNLLEMNAAMESFKPSNYIADSEGELNDMSTRFNENNNAWSQRINEVIDDRTTLLLDTYQSYDEHVVKLEEDMLRNAEANSELLRQNQNMLLEAQLETQEENEELIGAFNEKLANTRIGSQTNNDFLSFLVTPIQTMEVGDGSQTSFRPPEAKAMSHVMNWLPLVAIILVGGFALVAGSWFAVRAVKARQARGSETQDDPYLQYIPAPQRGEESSA